MENIDKKSAIKALVEKGKAVGKLTTQEILTTLTIWHRMLLLTKQIWQKVTMAD